MSKYSNYVYGGELVYSDGQGYQVFYQETLRITYLIKKTKEIAWKNGHISDENEIQKWIRKWEKNAENQLYRLEVRIKNLIEEQIEIEEILRGE